MSLAVPDPGDAFGGRLDRLPALSAGWEYTAGRLSEISNALNEAFTEEASRAVAVFLAGSYGRLEAGPASDADLMVVYDDDVSPRVLQSAFSVARDTMHRLGIPDSNPRGAFREPFSLASLKDLRAGEEDTRTLTRRMLLLMEARCVHNPTNGDRVLGALLDFYLQYHEDEPDKEMVVLLNDTIRYFRQICADYQWSFPVDKDRWALRNVKLRHSRLFIYLGLLLPIMNASRDEHRKRKREYIESVLTLPPAARITRVLDEVDRGNVADRVLGFYDTFLAAVRDPSRREQLQVEYEERHRHEIYARLKKNSDRLKSCVAELLYEQRDADVWSRSVFEYLVL